MKAISVRQPWAIFTCMKWKTIETRTHDRFKSLVGRRIAIHGASQVDDAGFLSEYFTMAKTALDLRNITTFALLRRGCLVCTAKVAAAEWAPDIHFDEWEDWSNRAMCDVSGKYCLFLEDIEPIVGRVRFRGRQGIFNVPDEVLT